MGVWEVMCETAIKHVHTCTHTHVCIFIHMHSLAQVGLLSETWQVLGRGDRVWGRPGTAWVCPVWSLWGLLGGAGPCA